ncbi:MAG: hypothetical protein FWC32_14385 [Firmicutes bacterium]|nr:hypothetical protein [Bacillota bacterium]
MKYCSNWDKTKARHAAFWNGTMEKGDCLHSVFAIKDFSRPINPTGYPFPDGEEDRLKWWTDPEIIIRRNRECFDNTYYAGDAFPILFHNLGPTNCAGYFEGAVPRFGPSVWYAITLEDYSQLKFDPNSFMYKKSISLAEEYVLDAQGDYIVSMADTSGIADALSGLRGPEQFMLDLLDRPEEVKDALVKVQAVWEDVNKKIYEIVRENNSGGSSVGWLQTWALGLHGQIQCDMSVMVSPGMFDEFCMYELRKQSEFLDYSLYHFDGYAQTMHLDQMLSVKELDAIQWTNIAGQGPSVDFIPELQKIQKAGKRLILDSPPHLVKELLDNLEASKMYIRTWVGSPADADNMVKMIGQYARD